MRGGWRGRARVCVPGVRARGCAMRARSLFFWVVGRRGAACPSAAWALVPRAVRAWCHSSASGSFVGFAGGVLWLAPTLEAAP